jgi:hypothetical protein
VKYKVLKNYIQERTASFFLNSHYHQQSVDEVYNMELRLIIYKLKINITDMKHIKFNRK